MTYPRDDLVRYRFERAKETLEEAELMMSSNHLFGAANRLYYACFYAVSALLVRHEFASSKHSGVMSLLNRNFVKTGKISVEYGKFYSRMFDHRSKSDYADMLAEPDVVSEDLKTAKDFIEAIQQLIKE